MSMSMCLPGGSAFSTFPDGVKLEEFAPLTKVLFEMPRFFADALFARIRLLCASDASHPAVVTKEMACDYWAREVAPYDEEERFWNMLPQLPDLQCAWLLLLSCANPRFN